MKHPFVLAIFVFSLSPYHARAVRTSRVAANGRVGTYPANNIPT